MKYIEIFKNEESVIIDSICMITGVDRRSIEFCRNLDKSNDIYIESRSGENITILHKGIKSYVSLRNQDEIDSLIKSIDTTLLIILDITFLPVNIWAIMVRRLILLGKPHRIIYKSSENYENMDTGETIEEFHISEEIEGIAPIAGFFRLNRPKSNQTKIFIPILGFQGSRAQYIIDKEIERDYAIFPFLTVPGIRSDYGRIALYQNKQLITQINIYRNLKYYSAWSPFEAIDEMISISSVHNNSFIKIALLGNKPSSLGAVIFTMICEKRGGATSQIIFDHPKMVSDFNSRKGVIYIYDTMSYWIATV